MSHAVAANAPRCRNYDSVEPPPIDDLEPFLAFRPELKTVLDERMVYIRAARKLRQANKEIPKDPLLNDPNMRNELMTQYPDFNDRTPLQIAGDHVAIESLSKTLRLVRQTRPKRSSKGYPTRKERARTDVFNFIHD